MTILKKIKIVLVVVMLNISTPSYAHAGIEDFLSWIGNSILELFNIFHECINTPNFNSFSTGSTVLNLSNKGKWMPTGMSVDGGKSLQINWTTQGIASQPRKYMIMYRIDPRFSRSQVFILKYNYNETKYHSDFHEFNEGALVEYQNAPTSQIPNLNVNSAATAFNSYYNFNGRDKIEIAAGDVVNLTLISSQMFFSKSPDQFSGELDPQNSNLLAAYSSSSLPDNRLLYMKSNTWCNQFGSHIPSNVSCIDYSGEYLYGGPYAVFARFVGLMDLPLSPNMQSCAATASGLSNSLCVYDKGRGMPIVNGSEIIKPTYTPFTHSAFNNIDFFYYQAESSGFLDFVDQTSIPIGGMFSNFSQYMSSWGSQYTNYSNVANTLTDGNGANGLSKFLYLGRYIIMAEVGNSNTGIINAQRQGGITVSYQVSAAGPPSGDGIAATQNYYGDAPSTGKLWLKVDNPDDSISGTVTVGYAGYTGSTFLSEIMYNSIALPVMNLMRDTAQMFYMALATDPTWQLTIKTLLTLYIVIYSLYFLSGMLELKLKDLVTRVIKIAVVFAMFSPTSWDFFYSNVFALFLDGMGYLFSNVVGLTSSTTNLFGFVDVVFNKYLNPTLWQLLLFQLISITNGLTILALLVIFSILKFMGVVIDVVVAYIFAFLTVAILISLAPLFIACMLFEKTKGIFDNWFSLLFKHMIHPTILIIFFLIIDQLMTNQLTQAVTRACWGILIPFSINIPWVDGSTISFSLPFLPGIPGFVPEVGDYIMPGPTTGAMGHSFLGICIASFMFWVYAELIKGLVSYTEQIASVLTNAAPARQSGNRQSSSNPADRISGDIKGAIKGGANLAMAPIRAAGREFKSKVIDDKFSTQKERSNSGGEPLKTREGGEGVPSNKNETTKPNP